MVTIFGQKWWYSGKVVAFGQNPGCIGAKWLPLWQIKPCIREKGLHLGSKSCNHFGRKLLLLLPEYNHSAVVFGHQWLSLIQPLWLYSRNKWLYSGKVRLYSGNSGCFRAKYNNCIREYSGSIRAIAGTTLREYSCCIEAMCLHFARIQTLVFGQSGCTLRVRYNCFWAKVQCILPKVVVFCPHTTILP